MNRSNFFTLLDRYGDLIVKPVNGTGGTGIVLVTPTGNGMYTIRYGRTTRKASRENLYASVKRAMRRRKYIVQQRVPLARIQGRPFDARVVAQKKRGSGWIVTGMMAKKAGRGNFVTNLSRGGRGLSLAAAVRRSNIRSVGAGTIRTRLRRAALVAARRLNRRYRRLRIVGFDMGIDPSGKVWIIEANFRPDITSFRWLRDKSTYRRILYYSRQR